MLIYYLSIIFFSFTFLDIFNPLSISSPTYINVFVTGILMIPASFIFHKTILQISIIILVLF